MDGQRVEVGLGWQAGLICGCQARSLGPILKGFNQGQFGSQEAGDEGLS